MFRCTAILCSLILAGAPLAASAKKPSADPVFSQIDGIVKSLSEITGLPEKHPVAYGRMTKTQLRQFLNRRIKKTLDPEEIRADETSLKMFGLVPQDFDLKKSTIDLLTEQAAAFYDYDEKKLFLMQDASLAEERTTLAHELSHALADQHFNLENFMEETPSNDDENLAHTAVVEGQASWLMLAYELKRNGQDPGPTAEMLKSIGDSGDTSLLDYPILNGSPLYIQQSLLFPYSQGTIFFDAVYHKLGKGAFAAVFKDPPADSSQIIHPDRYFAHLKLAHPDVPKASLGEGSKQLTEGTLGEFDHSILLKQYLGAPLAAELAPHLRGGTYRVRTTGKHRKPVLEYAAQWDSKENANSFFEAYEKILRAKWKHCEASGAQAGLFAGTGDNGYFVVRLNGDTVSSVEGLADEAEWRRLQAPGGP